MKKIIILIPVFNDWESLKKLIEEINETIKFFQNIQFAEDEVPSNRHFVAFL